MVAREMVGRDVSVRQTAAHLGVDESTLRYHLARPSDAPHHKEWNVRRVRAWSVRDGFNVVWLELGPPKLQVARATLRLDRGSNRQSVCSGRDRAESSSTARNSALFDWNTKAAGYAGF